MITCHHSPHRQHQWHRVIVATPPSTKDIVCGRGRGLDQLDGNKMFRSYIKKASAKYTHKNTSKADKSSISTSIRQQIQNEGMRFIKKDKHDVWRELSISEIQLKIGHALRDCRQRRTVWHAKRSNKFKGGDITQIQEQCSTDASMGGPSINPIKARPQSFSEAACRQKCAATISTSTDFGSQQQENNGILSTDCQAAMDDFTSIKQSLLCDFPNDSCLKLPSQPLSNRMNSPALPLPGSFGYESRQNETENRLVDLFLGDICGVNAIFSQLDDFDEWLAKTIID